MHTTYPAHGDTRKAEEEELIHAGNDDGPNQPNNPAAQRGLSSGFRKPRLLDGGVSKRTWDFENPPSPPTHA